MGRDDAPGPTHTSPGNPLTHIHLNPDLNLCIYPRLYLCYLYPHLYPQAGRELKLDI